MKKIFGLLICILLVLICTAAIAAEIDLDETTFPDANFRTFLINNTTYTTDGTRKYYTDEQIATITSINCSQKEIQSLNGIENFTALKSLICETNKLTSLNLSNAELTILNCNGNELTELNVSMCIKLGFLFCEKNKLTNLDISNNQALYDLRCNSNQLQTLTIGEHPGYALQGIHCQNNKLTTVDVSKCPIICHCISAPDRYTDDADGVWWMWNTDNGFQGLQIDKDVKVVTDTGTITAGTDIPDQCGKCWDNKYWWELNNGVLTIQATGDPNAFTYDWYAGFVKKVIIKDGVLSIPDHAFNAHTGITEITIPASVTDIGVGAFFRCTGISEIHIPEGVQTIFNETFYGCSNLKTLYFPISLTKVIGFATTESGLTDVYYAGTEDDWKKIEIIADGNDELLKATIHYQGEEEPEKPEATITLSKTKLTIKGVNTKTVTATLSDSDDSISSVNSSNTNVANATFSGDEIQIASSKKKGKATVTVTTAKGATAKLTVTVKAGWALNAKKITLKPKKTFKIKVLAIPSTIKATNFISDKPAIAAVDSKGKVKALKKGKAAITVTLNNGKTLKLKVTVK